MATFAERLGRELDRWVAEGIVSREQADTIRRRYGPPAEERRGRLAALVAIAGAVVAGLGVILFFAANWSAIPHLARLLLLVAAIVGAYAVGDRLRDERPRTAHGFVLLGVILFGASIFLVGQMEHVSTHDPLGFLLWALAATSVGLVWRSEPIALLAVALAAAWQAHELFEGLADDVARAALGPAAVLYGTALYTAGTGFAARLRPLGFAWPMRGAGLLLASTPLYVYSIDGVTHELRDRHPLAHTMPLLIVAALVVATLAGLVALVRGRPWEAVGLGAVALLGVLPALLDVHRGIYVVAFGLLALGLIAAGVDGDEEWLVNLGVVAVGIELVTRLFDVFGRMLPRSAAFLLSGLLLLALAWALERGRSQLVARMRA